ncbi:hypothetical protein [Nannocystis punicea]|uniref:Uncharacterized protein n=1 Tax=Nannocystis punicea TaxID=2995304 RepID=A0ABY7GV36_9BACT|nr:hypothetical protein [Nannocystis poenicansa]WAS90836.1 hypothetical protein O0S08_32000 [Nannocystis poenicansa]
MQRTLAILITFALPQLFACDPGDSDSSAAPEALDDADATDLPLTAPIDVEPATHEAAAASLKQINALLDKDPADARALAALAAIQPKLDELNHLVARVNVAPGHEVGFYESETGVLITSESRPLGAPRALDVRALAAGSMADEYRRLAGADAKVPEALVEAQALAEERLAARGGQRKHELPAPSLAAADAGTVTPLTAADGQWFTDNVCYGSEADFKTCLPNWGGGAYAYTDAKTSSATLAPYIGNVVLRAQYDGSTTFTQNVLQNAMREAWLNSPWDWDCGIFACSDWDYDEELHRWDANDASGDHFHFAAGFNSSCYGSDLDCPWML